MSQSQPIDIGPQVSPSESMVNKPKEPSTSRSDGSAQSYCYCLAPKSDCTLAAIDVPAFILDESGTVIRFNGKAASLLDRDSLALRRSFAEMVLRGLSSHAWNLIPLRGTNEATEFLAIQRLQARRALSADRTGVAATRWNLTGRQRQVLGLVAHGVTNADIAEMLGIVERTVEFHLSCIFDKAGVDNRATLIARVADLSVTSSSMPAITSQSK